jgi:PhzF family phenazine biosynthesis protein
VPFVADALSLTLQDMQSIARTTGHESAFVLLPSTPEAHWNLRFFVPQHEMEMCGHATVGTLWALRQWGWWHTPTARIETLSGLVDVEWDAVTSRVWISQPAVHAEALTLEACRRVATVLGLPEGRVPAMTNARTSRVKTLVQMPDVAALNALRPDFSVMEALCESIGSTGIYPYALAPEAGKVAADHPVVTARQFPKASGYPEDAATGIAAAALWGQLAATGVMSVGSPGTPVVCSVRQGDAMGRPSAIDVRARFGADAATVGCWVSGQVVWGGPR